MNREEPVAGADADEEAVESVLSLVAALRQVTEAMKAQEALREVITVLILRLGEAVLDLQIAAGRFGEANKLGEAYGMAAAALNMSKLVAQAEREEE